jgi:hypothetical protein
MALKTNLTEAEKYGLSEEECKLATKWLRKHKTSGALKELEAAKLFELFLLGDPIVKLAQNFPQYPIGQIAFTAAYRGWFKDRDKMLSTLKDRVSAKVVKSVLDQVDFLTAMMAVVNAEHLVTMQNYIKDPASNPKPNLRIESIKEYKEIAETLSKIVSSATSSDDKNKSKQSPMLGALSSHADQRRLMAAKVTEVENDDAEDAEVTLADLS